MARRFVPIMAVMALAVAACYAFEAGREQSWTVQHAATDVKQRATTHLSRTGYQVLHADDRLIEAEKQRDVGSFDVLRVIVESAATDGTRVRVQALSEEGEGGARKESRDVSATALGDGQTLVDALMTRPGGL